MAAELDHLVLATPDLAAGTDELERLTGLRPVAGGAHLGLGTRNALLGLTWRGGRRCYLELLGPDPEQPDAPRDAMMLDLGARLADWPGGLVRTHTWVVRPTSPAHGAPRPVDRRSDAAAWMTDAPDGVRDAGTSTSGTTGIARTGMDRVLDRARAAGVHVGPTVETSRVTPAGVRLSWRLTTPRPLGMGGLQPSLIEWGSTAHPSDALLPSVELAELVLQHPDPAGARARLGLLGVEHVIRYGPGPRLTVDLDTPRGRVSVN